MTKTAKDNPSQTIGSRPLAPGKVPDQSRLPELLAPAGDWECARAAVENGADAIYFGLERFNARMRAHNFTAADLPRLMAYLHGRGVKGYVTLNTLVFQNEMADAEGCLRAMITAGVDAVIVQDVGLCRLIRQLSPDFPIHASTQMTVTSAGGVAFAKELGCHLVVLARECSLREIEQIQAVTRDQLAATGHPQLPLEVFVHGALCVAYSGQCLTSEALGGRSANRGECAQACRMPYDLVSDGQKVPLGDRRYLLSPQDLCGLDVLPELARLGVASLKIEGRLKSPEYVASITRVYRQALDNLAAGAPQRTQPSSDRPGALTDRPERPASPNPRTQATSGRPAEASRYEVEMAFSRGLYTGWFGGIDNQRLVHARFGKKRGVYLGTVERVLEEEVVLRLEAPLKPGDGVVFDAGNPESKEEGGRVYRLEKQGGKARLSFGRGAIDFHRLHPGDKLWKTSDPELERELRQTFSGETPRFRRPVVAEVHGRAGDPLTVIVRDLIGHTVQVHSAMPLMAAQAQPLTTERLRDQLGRLGGTPFQLAELHNHLAGDAILPLSELNRLRREWVSQLESLRTLPKRWTLRSPHRDSPGAPETERAKTCDLAPARPSGDAVLTVLVRTMDQLEAALASEVQTLYCEFEDPKRYRPAVQRFRTWQEQSGQRQAAIYVAPPRIFKSGEEWILKQVRACEADGYLVRNYEHLQYFAGCRCVGDYSLNIANALSAEYFKTQFNLERVTASYDLNAAQLEALLAAAPPEWFEITIHQHMPMFHMEHCVFCAFLSTGTDYTNCGRPCDRHHLQLQDRVGAKHPVKADAGCRNTVFNSLAQTGAEHVSKLRHLGARSFRLEFLDEEASQVKQTIVEYRKLLRDQTTGASLWRELKVLNQLGVTRGQMAVP